MNKIVYREDFETGELRAWASYPPCQDTAYDPFAYPGKIRPDDDGTCLVAVKYPPWNETQLLGAVKQLDLILDPDSLISFRYYIKTVDHCSELEVHIPLVPGDELSVEGTIDCSPDTVSMTIAPFADRDRQQCGVHLRRFGGLS